MILIVTHSRDLSADFVIRHLLAYGKKYLRLDTDRLGTPECFFGARSTPEFHIKGQVVRRDDVTAIWCRRFALPEILRQVKPEHSDFVKRELGVVMDAFLEGDPSTYQINPSTVDRLSGNRLVQAERAQAAGFAIPDTLVTQNSDDARAFLKTHKSVVCKALGFGQIVATSGAELVAYASTIPVDASLAGLALCPALFQEKIPNRFDWRITTVDDRAFCARARFDAKAGRPDWRQDERSATKFERAEAPPTVIERLLRLCHDSGLIYGAHDLIEAESGEFFFLETNPAGQWGWLELTLGLPIGQAIADALSRHGGP